MSQFVWSIQIDWNNDGIYESDEAVRLVRGTITRGTDAWLSSPNAGVAEIVLRNHDRRFDTWYSGSPLYGQDPAGKRMRIKVTIDGTEYTVFTGTIQSATHSGFRAAGAPGTLWRQCTIVAHDGWQVLRDGFVDIALLTNTNTRAAISALLDALGWSVAGGAWILGSGQLDSSTILGGILNAGSDLGSDPGDTLPYFWAFADKDVMTQIVELVDSHWGRCFIKADGTFVFRTLAADNDEAVALTLGDDPLQELQVVSDWSTLYNEVRVYPRPHELGVVSAVYTWEETPLEMMPGESRTLLINFVGPSGERVPVVNVVTPVSGTDYKAYANQDGTGANYTGNVSLTFTLYSSSAKAVITNAGTAVFWLTLFQVRGQPIQSVQSQSVKSENIVSIERRGRRILERQGVWLEKSLIAQDLATFGQVFFSELHPGLIVRTQSAEQAFGYDLGAKALDGTSVGTGNKFRLAQIIHEIQENGAGQNILTTWRFDPLFTDDFWRLDSSTLSVLGLTTKLGV